MSILSNSIVKDLALKQLKGYMQGDGVTMIAVYIDDNGDFKFNEYKEPVIVMTKENRDKAVAAYSEALATIENLKNKNNGQD